MGETIFAGFFSNFDISKYYYEKFLNKHIGIGIFLFQFFKCKHISLCNGNKPFILCLDQTLLSGTITVETIKHFEMKYLSTKCDKNIVSKFEYFVKHISYYSMECKLLREQISEGFSTKDMNNENTIYLFSMPGGYNIYDIMKNKR